MTAHYIPASSRRQKRRYESVLSLPHLRARQPGLPPWPKAPKGKRRNATFSPRTPNFFFNLNPEPSLGHVAHGGRQFSTEDGDPLLFFYIIFITIIKDPQFNAGLLFYEKLFSFFFAFATFNNLHLDILRHFTVLQKFHTIRSTSLSHRTHNGSVAKHFG